MLYQLPLPPKYAELAESELSAGIRAIKEQLGRRLVILGHHYQQDDVIEFADFTGDSLGLSQQAAEQDAEYIVFCGVHFMAESADILSSEGQTVCLPNLAAGCAMADMADYDAVSTALEEIARLLAPGRTVLPISYVNSSAAIKALTGQHGGACCTSSNVRTVFDWALRPADQSGGGAEKLFAVPDEHLARNTAVAMGYNLEDCAVYDPALPDGGLDAEQLDRATFILWRGHCYVHQVFRPEDVRAARQADPDVKVIVHPECPREVVAEADLAGSTSQIIRTLSDAPPGSHWAVGTEANLVHRLARRHEHHGKQVRLLSDVPARCAQMAQIDLPHLLWCLDCLAEDNPHNVIAVNPDTARDARTALQRMLDLKPTGS